MPLTEEQMATIRSEEHFRAEVRKALERRPPASLLEKLAAFFETRVGYWLLTTVLAAAAVSGYDYFREQLAEDEARERKRVEQIREVAAHARRDTETMLKLAPLLLSRRQPDDQIAAILLKNLAERNAVDSSIAMQVSKLFATVETAGSAADADAAERRSAEKIASVVDEPLPPTNGAGIVETPAAEAPPATPRPLDTTLVPRMYLHIAAEADRPRAESAGERFRIERILVPGIERVENQRAPRQAQVRYCDGQVDDMVLARVKAVAEDIIDSPKIVALPATLCGNVRFNHFELWYPRAG